MAFELASTAAVNLMPGAERPYLVHHRLSLAAEAIGDTEMMRVAALEAGELLKSALKGLDPKQADLAVKRVPAHQEIMARTLRHEPKTITVRLPSMSAPTGRAVSDDEIVSVLWTIRLPEDDQIDDEVERRQHQLLRLLSEADGQGARPTVQLLAEALDVSATTIRRDIDALREDGHEARTRGQRQTGT